MNIFILANAAVPNDSTKLVVFLPTLPTITWIACAIARIWGSLANVANDYGWRERGIFLPTLPTFATLRERM